MRRNRVKLQEYSLPTSTKNASGNSLDVRNDSQLPRIQSAPATVFQDNQHEIVPRPSAATDPAVIMHANFVDECMLTYKKLMVIQILMSEFIEARDYVETVGKEDAALIIHLKAERLGIFMTLEHVDEIITKLSSEYDESSDLIDRLYYLKNHMLSKKIILNTRIAILIRNQLEGFTQTFRNLTTEQRSQVDEMMQEKIKAFSSHDCDHLYHWLQYAGRPNIPGEELPRLPEGAVSKLAEKISSSNHDSISIEQRQQLYCFITDYLKLAKNGGFQFLKLLNNKIMTFCSAYATLSIDEKANVETIIINRLTLVTIDETNYLKILHESLRSYKPQNQDQRFPSSIIHAIATSVKNNMFVVKYSNILELAMSLVKEKLDTMRLFMQFIADYKDATSDAKNKILAIIADQITHTISHEDFINHKSIFELLESVLNIEALATAIKARELLINDDQHLNSNANYFEPPAQTLSVTDYGMFGVALPTAPTQEALSLRK